MSNTSPLKTGVNSGAPEGYSCGTCRVTLVMCPVTTDMFLLPWSHSCPSFLSFITGFFNKSNTTGAISGAGTEQPFWPLVSIKTHKAKKANIYVYPFRQQPFSYLGGGGWDFFEKHILMPQLTEKKFRFCIVAEKNMYADTGQKLFLW